MGVLEVCHPKACCCKGGLPELNKKHKPCRDCEITRLNNTGHRMCERCREFWRLTGRRAQLKARSKGLCIRCRCRTVMPGRVSCSRCLEYERTRRHVLHSEQKKYLTLRDEVFTAYGGYMCVCCGETEKVFLTIDHIDDSHKEPRKDRSKLYRWLRRNNYPEGFRVLCYNCNCGRARNGGICPHEKQKPLLSITLVPGVEQVVSYADTNT